MKSILSIAIFFVILFSMGCPPIPTEYAEPIPDIQIEYSWAFSSEFLFEVSAKNLTDYTLKDIYISLDSNIGQITIPITGDIPAHWEMNGIIFSYITPNEINSISIVKVVAGNKILVFDAYRI